LPAKERKYSEMQMPYIISLNNIGDTYFCMGKYEQALEYHLKALNCLPREFSTTSEEMFQVISNIAHDYDRLGKKGEAIGNLFKSLQTIYGREFGDMEKMIDMYEKLGTDSKDSVGGLNFSKIMRSTEPESYTEV
jgi:tetratricopeptide (TPR) repeat protein